MSSAWAADPALAPVLEAAAQAGLSSPASIFDLLDVQADYTPTQWLAVQGQLACGLSFVQRREGHGVVACAGLCPMEGGLWEAWFAIRWPNDDDGGWQRAIRERHRLLWPAVSAARLTLAAFPYPLGTTTVTKAGRRLARTLGFRPTEHAERWLWHR